MGIPPIRSLFDAWVICGRVTVCDTKQPAPGVLVSALDRDWLKDDPLGTATTDANGRFRIDYLGADFRHGTFLDVELFGGPDVYFHITSPSGDPLLTEPSNMGRAPGRENVGPCFCADLCVKDPPIVRFAWFTRVGDFNIYSDINSVTGLTASAQPSGFPNQHGGPGYGFWGDPKLIGDCPTTHPSSGQPMRYRFLTRPSGSAAAGTPITGSAVTAVKVGTRPVPWNFGFGVLTYPQDIYVAGFGGYTGPMPAPLPPPPAGPPPGSGGPMPPLVLQPDADGWITMPPDATNQGFSGPLLRFHSAAVVPGGTPSNNGPGNPVSLANQRSGVDLEIIFEAAPTPGHLGSLLTNSLSRIHINNWLEASAFSLDQLAGPGTTPCSGITNAIDVRYTIDHELIAGWSISLTTSAPTPGNFTLTQMGHPPALGETETPRGGNGQHHVDTSTGDPCAYAISFSRRLKLTDGEIDDSGRSPIVALFCRT